MTLGYSKHKKEGLVFEVFLKVLTKNVYIGEECDHTLRLLVMHRHYKASGLLIN